MKRRNLTRSDPFADRPESSDNLFEMDERILGAINAADASMQTAYPTSIHDLDPDPAQPRRVVPSAVRKAVPAGTRAPDLLEWWAVLAYQERHGHKPADAHQAHFYLRSVVAGEPEERDDEPGLIEAALLRVADLAADIRARGKLIHPIHITPAGRIVTGERRWLAHHLLTLYDYPGFDKIMAVEGEYDVWIQASENNQRSDLNAIGRARQFAILLMDLLKREGVEFLPLRDFEDEQDYYAQVADSKQYRIPHGGLSDLLNAMGVKGRQSLSNYRRLLSLPKDVWVIADDENWSRDDLLKIVHSVDNLDDDEQEVDADPGQGDEVGEGEAIPNIASGDLPAPIHQHEPASDGAYRHITLDGALIPEGFWVDAYKALHKGLDWYLMAVETRDGFIFLREDAKTAAAAVPTTMPGCNTVNAEYGMAFFCPPAVIDYLAQSHHTAIVKFDDDRLADANDFWFRHMVINRRQKPVQQSTTTKPAPVEVQENTWRPSVGDQVVIPSGQVGKVTFIVNKDKVSVRTARSVGVYEIARLEPYIEGATADDGPGDDGVDPQQSQDDQDAPRFVLPFTAEQDSATSWSYNTMDKNRRKVGSWRPSPAYRDESVRWFEAMVDLMNTLNADAAMQAHVRLHKYLNGRAYEGYFPEQAMADLEMVRAFDEHAADALRKGSDWLRSRGGKGGAE